MTDNTTKTRNITKWRNQTVTTENSTYLTHFSPFLGSKVGKDSVWCACLDGTLTQQINFSKYWRGFDLLIWDSGGSTINCSERRRWAQPFICVIYECNLWLLWHIFSADWLTLDQSWDDLNLTRFHDSNIHVSFIAFNNFEYLFLTSEQLASTESTILSTKSTQLKQHKKMGPGL